MTPIYQHHALITFIISPDPEDVLKIKVVGLIAVEAPVRCS